MTHPTRREILGTAAATAGAIMAEVEADAAQAKAADLPAFRFQLGKVKDQVFNGGVSRQATADNFPVSKGIAGVYMRLEAGGLRELHWHANAAEWAYMLAGRARTTIFDPDGRSQRVDFGPGDVWYFPRGYGHSIQGLGPDGCTFILAFDNGYFSDFATFSITDWLAHTPREVLAKNLGVPAASFAAFPKKEVYITRGPVPPPLPADPPPGSENSSPLSHRFRLEAQAPRVYAGGDARIVSVKNFPVSKTMCGATMRLKPGGLRDLHWHPNADEWQYFISGRARVTVFASGGRAATDDFEAGDVGYVPMGYGHYLENIGTDDCRILFVFNSGEYQDIGLAEWLASNPRELVATNFGVPEALVAKFPTKRVFIAGGEK
jgi:oxalate decarboxylase